MKRLFALAVWTYALWYAGAFLEGTGVLPATAGLAAGLVVGTVVAVDPARRFWRRPNRVLGARRWIGASRSFAESATRTISRPVRRYRPIPAP